MNNITFFIYLLIIIIIIIFKHQRKYKENFDALSDNANNNISSLTITNNNINNTNTKTNNDISEDIVYIEDKINELNKLIDAENEIQLRSDDNIINNVNDEILDVSISTTINNSYGLFILISVIIILVFFCSCIMSLLTPSPNYENKTKNQKVIEVPVYIPYNPQLFKPPQYNQLAYNQSLYNPI